MGEAWYKANIWDVNVSAAVEFAAEARRALPADIMVVTPAPFSAPDWDQLQYLGFWEELLRTRVRLVWFNRNWEFSNGCALEFAVAQDAGLRTFDHEGKALDCRTGIERLTAAMQQLELDGFDVSTLRENLARLQAVRNCDP
jgi:hypothetical protein